MYVTSVKDQLVGKSCYDERYILVCLAICRQAGYSLRAFNKNVLKITGMSVFYERPEKIIKSTHTVGSNIKCNIDNCTNCTYELAFSKCM
jgi:hypothetical protein